MWWITAVLTAVLFMSGCARPLPAGVTPLPMDLPATPTLAATSSPGVPLEESVKPPATATAPPPVVTPSATPLAPTATPFYTGELSPACGLILPAVAETAVVPSTTLNPNPAESAVVPSTALNPNPAETAVVPSTSLNPDAAALAQVESRIPDAARDAWAHILRSPGTVGLAAYRVGQEAEGVYLNADVPMPLGSVVKLVHLVAYAEAVGSGELDPLTPVPVAELERYYQPHLDLGAHRRALAELAAMGRVWGDPPTVLLEDVPWMMMRFSSNAAMDYLHLLLGQARIEETAVALGLTSQTAPCPFLAQFLAMSNMTRGAASDYAALQTYLADPALYGREAMLFADAFAHDPDFRDAQNEWRRAQRRPSVSIQRAFTEALNPQAAAREYAALLARLAQNGLSNPNSSFIARRYLEWPMIFEDNQALFSNLGFKNGTMPGVLNLVYYAYPQGEVTPLVVVLFFHDLPTYTYRQWRYSLTHDEFARWLLYDPQAITAVANVIGDP